MKRIYMDHSATTPCDPEVAQVMLEYMTSTFGNASSIHSFGREGKKALEDARERVAKALGAQPAEIFFTSGGTEADNIAITGVARANLKRGNHIVTSAIEHHAVLDTCEKLTKEGFEVTVLPVDEYGLISLEDLNNAITDKTILITIMHANNEIGTIQPIAEIGAIAKEKGIIFHTDGVQSVGKIPVDVNDLNVDLLSISAHKFYGPKGVGALYIRKGVRILPISFGGSQERKRRPGTENIPGIVGLSIALEKAVNDLEKDMDYLINLRERLIKGITERINHCQLNGHPNKRIPGNVNFSFHFVEGEALLLMLDMRGIAGSSGSACTSGSLDPSHVLLAMGLTHEVAHGSLRLSLGKHNTEEEIDYVVNSLAEILERLRAMSPLYNNDLKAGGNC